MFGLFSEVLYSVWYYYWAGISPDIRNDSVSNQIQALFCYEKRTSQSTNLFIRIEKGKKTTKRYLLLHKIRRLGIFVLVALNKSYAWIIICNEDSTTCDFVSYAFIFINWDVENWLPIVSFLKISYGLKFKEGNCKHILPISLFLYAFVHM